MRQLSMCLVLALALTVSACKSPFSEVDDSAGDSAAVFGEGVTLNKLTDIKTILENPNAFVGRKVAVRGKVRRVCPMKGCWIELEGASSRKIQVKVEDGVIVFPESAVGKSAMAEGVVERLSLTSDEYAAQVEREAEENGETFDPARIGEPPYEIIRIWGSGALIYLSP